MPTDCREHITIYQHAKRGCAQCAAFVANHLRDRSIDQPACVIHDTWVHDEETKGGTR